MQMSIPINKRFKIVLCEIHNPNIHGIDNNSDPKIAGHYLVHYSYNVLEGDDNDNDYWEEDWYEENPCIYDDIASLRNHIQHIILPNNTICKHPFIRNYRQIISNTNYLKPEIALCIHLSGGEYVGILKTFWLRIVQRTWKRIYKERTAKNLMRTNPNSLRHRELTGKWPSQCIYLPGLRGMLLKK